MNSVSAYYPSSDMFQALELDFSDQILNKNDPVFATYLNSCQLNYDNAYVVLRKLINIEDLHTLSLYFNLIQRNVMTRKTKKGNLSIEHPKERQVRLVPDIDDVLLQPPGSVPSSLKLIDYISILSKCSNIFKITNVTNERIVLENKVGPQLISKPFDVLIQSPRIPYRLMYRALNIFESNCQLRRYLYPKDNCQRFSNKLDTFPLINNAILKNPEQLQAVRQIVAGPNPEVPYIIFGPPGTGKTSTIVEAILQLSIQKQSRILVTASSNSACDTIALKLIKGLIAYKESERTTKVALLRLISKTRFRKVGRKSIHNLVYNESNFAPSRNGKWNLNDFNIVVATFCMAAIHCKEGYSYIFIDEAAACLEPETLMAIAGIKNFNCHVVLSGDHKQLAAVVINKHAKSLGLEKSMMERLMGHNMYKVDDQGNYDKTSQSRLVLNYRNHPEIVELFSQLYYNGLLKPMAPKQQVNQAINWKMLPNGQYPILCVQSSGRSKSLTNSTSKYNCLEAQALSYYVKLLIDEGLNDVKVNASDIAVITPYLSQSILLKDLLRQDGYRHVEVGTVEHFQGCQKLFVIVSLVASYKETKFIFKPRRINTLISRPEALLILIGNLANLSANDDFKFIINECEKKGNLVSYKEALDEKRFNLLIAKLKLDDYVDSDDE